MPHSCISGPVSTTTGAISGGCSTSDMTSHEESATSTPQPRNRPPLFSFSALRVLLKAKKKNLTRVLRPPGMFKRSPGNGTTKPQTSPDMQQEGPERLGLSRKGASSSTPALPRVASESSLNQPFQLPHEDPTSSSMVPSSACEDDYNAFVQSYAVPVQLYRYLSQRSANHPVLLHRNLMSSLRRVHPNHAKNHNGVAPRAYCPKRSLYDVVHALSHRQRSSAQSSSSLVLPYLFTTWSESCSLRQSKFLLQVSGVSSTHVTNTLPAWEVQVNLCFHWEDRRKGTEGDVTQSWFHHASSTTSSRMQYELSMQRDMYDAVQRLCGHSRVTSVNLQFHVTLWHPHVPQQTAAKRTRQISLRNSRPDAKDHKASWSILPVFLFSEMPLLLPHADAENSCHLLPGQYRIGLHLDKTRFQRWVSQEEPDGENDESSKSPKKSRFSISSSRKGTSSPVSPSWGQRREWFRSRLQQLDSSKHHFEFSVIREQLVMEKGAAWKGEPTTAFQENKKKKKVPCKRKLVEDHGNERDIPVKVRPVSRHEVVDVTPVRQQQQQQHSNTIQTAEYNSVNVIFRFWYRDQVQQRTMSTNWQCPFCGWKCGPRDAIVGGLTSASTGVVVPSLTTSNAAGVPRMWAMVMHLRMAHPRFLFNVKYSVDNTSHSRPAQSRGQAMEASSSTGCPSVLFHRQMSEPSTTGLSSRTSSITGGLFLRVQVDVHLNLDYDGSKELLTHRSNNGPQSRVFPYPGPTRRHAFTQCLHRDLCWTESTRSALMHCSTDPGTVRESLTWGHTRQYYHTWSTLPVALSQLWNPHPPSEWEEDAYSAQWIRQHYIRNMNEFLDVNDGEKCVMRLWSVFLLGERSVADCYLFELCQRFLRRHVRQDLASWRVNVLLHFHNLLDYGLITPQQLVALMHIFDDETAMPPTSN